MRSKNLMAVMLVGIAAMLLYTAFTPDPKSPEDATARARSTNDTEELDEFGLAKNRTRIEWASWRTDEDTAEEPDPTPAREEQDPRLKEVLDGLQNVDVYIQGESNDR